MKRQLFLLLGLVLAISGWARDFSYTYQGNTVWYTVISEQDKTCKTKEGVYGNEANKVSGTLILPSHPKDGQVEYTLTEISQYSFTISQLESIVLPPTIQTTDFMAYNLVTWLKRCAYPKTLGGDPFYCTSYAVAYDPVGAQEINGWIYGPDKKSIRYAPYGLSGAYEIPSGITAIEDKAFGRLLNLSSVRIPDSVTSLGKYSFEGCGNLASVDLGNSVEYINEGAFHDCRTLSTITIPASVREINSLVFKNCSQLNTIISEGQTAAEIATTAFSSNTYKSAKLVIPTGRFQAYLNAGWIKFDNISDKAGNKVTEITDNVLKYKIYKKDEVSYGATVCGMANYNISEVSIPDKIFHNSKYYFIEAVGHSAFRECGSIKNVVCHQNSNLQSIGSIAFYISSIESVQLPNTVEIIGQAAFMDSNLRTIKLGESLRYIGPAAFFNARLTSIDLPETLTDMGPYAFSNCLLQSVKLPRSLTTVASGVFAENLYLNNIIIPSSITQIEDNAFEGCYRLNSVPLPNSIKSLGRGSFKGCRLKSIILPPSIERIAAEAFSDNTGLSVVVLGGKINEIGAKAFDNYSIQDVYITTLNPPVANDNTFSGYNTLHVANQSAKTAYEESMACWYRFNNFNVMIEPTDMVNNGPAAVQAQTGEQIQLAATLVPENVTLPYIFWRSTNPEVATVDHNGLVTVCATASGHGECKIIAESLYANGPQLEFPVNFGVNSIDNIAADATKTIDYTRPYEVFTLQGVCVGYEIEGLTSGLYIVRQGNQACKIAVN